MILFLTAITLHPGGIRQLQYPWWQEVTITLGHAARQSGSDNFCIFRHFLTFGNLDFGIAA
jgi:hypothetical protein